MTKFLKSSKQQENTLIYIIADDSEYANLLREKLTEESMNISSDDEELADTIGSYFFRLFTTYPLMAL